MPSYSVLLFSRWKITKIRSQCRGSMPMPLSLTERIHSFSFLDRGNMDLRGLISTKFNGVSNQILKYLQQLSAIRSNSGKRIVCNHGPRIGNGGSQISHCLIQ